LPFSTLQPSSFALCMQLKNLQKPVRSGVIAASILTRWPAATLAQVPESKYVCSIWRISKTYIMVFGYIEKVFC
jgi:hypothetical protein